MSKTTPVPPYFNIIVSADHGFVTNIGKEDIGDFLIKQGLKKDTQSDDVIIIAGAIYVKDHNPEVIKNIVTALQAQEWIGAIFTKGAKPGDNKGVVEGTLSFESIHWNHPERAADILVDENWNDDKNDKGYAGSSFSRGVAGHGGFSPYEVHIPLLAGGPSFKKNFESDLPTSNVDIVPTVLQIHKIAVQPAMEGRVMHELLSLKSNAPKLTAKNETIKVSGMSNGVAYTLTLDRTVLGKYTYTNFTSVERVRR